jgi:hypothetical protein
VRSTILALSLVLGVLPLAGIGWILASGMITPWPPAFTVDGLFMSLILLILSACFLLNAYWEARDQGLLKFMQKKPAALAATSAAKTPATAAASSGAPTAKVSS